MTDIQKQPAEALDLANDLWSKGCTSERLVKACDLLRQQHRRIEALEVELIGLRNAYRQQEARGPQDVPLTLLKNVRYLLSNAKLPSGMLIVGGRLKHPPTVCAETLAELEAIIERMDAAHGIKGV